MPMIDLKDYDDVVMLVDRFYDKVQKDASIGPVFNQVAKVHWPEHLPKMYRFWDSILFGTATYKGQAISKHLAIHHQYRLSKEHFDRWLGHWDQTVDELYRGRHADKAKEKAQSIAHLILYKIEHFDNPTSLV